MWRRRRAEPVGHKLDHRSDHGHKKDRSARPQVTVACLDGLGSCADRSACRAAGRDPCRGGSRTRAIFGLRACRPICDCRRGDGVSSPTPERLTRASPDGGKFPGRDRRAFPLGLVGRGQRRAQRSRQVRAAPVVGLGASWAMEFGRTLMSRQKGKKTGTDDGDRVAAVKRLQTESFSPQHQQDHRQYRSRKGGRALESSIYRALANV